MLRLIKDYAYLALVAFVAWYAVTTFYPGQPDLPDLAPSLVLEDASGIPHALEDLQGKPVVVNFWATWCPPCVAELPQLAAFARAHPEVQLLGVVLESGTAAEIRVEVDKRDIPYPVLLGDRQVKRLWDISTLPTTVIIGPGGRVLDAHVGGLDQSRLEALLDAALTQARPAAR